MKRIAYVLVIFVMMVFNVQVLTAGEAVDNKDDVRITYDGKPLNFKITSGLENKDEIYFKQEEFTFDTTRTIAGVADKGTEIVITVSEIKESDVVVKKEYFIEVGKSGVFSQEIILGVGRNYISVTASKNYSQANLALIINRIDSEVKNELENIVLPEQKLKNIAKTSKK